MLRLTDGDQRPEQLPPIYGYRIHSLLPLRQALAPILNKIHKLDEHIETAKAECHFPSEHGLTREESASIYLYTMDWGEQSLYRVLNTALRNSDRSILIPWHGYLKLFDTALSKLPSLETSLWRGINANVGNNYKENDEVTWWSFTSCTTTVKAVQQFLGDSATLFMIEAKYGKAISAYSKFRGENEVVLTLGTHLRVVGDLDHPTFKIIHLKEITDPINNDLSRSLTNMNLRTINQSNSNGSSTNDSSEFEAVKYENGDLYEGQLQNGKRNGKGTCYYANHNTYTGDWVDDQAEGQGFYSWPSGARYEGRFRNNKKNGKGTYYYASGKKYVGDWADDMQTGEGVLTWASGARYEGGFRNDKMNGKGAYYFATGKKYVGDWVDDMQTGEGILTWPSGARYEGQFKNDKMHGKGTYYFPTGKKYVGEWVNDMQTGIGVLTYPTGDRYEGQFLNDKKHGRGRMSFVRGQTQVGTWSNDVFMG